MIYCSLCGRINREDNSPRWIVIEGSGLGLAYLRKGR
jgi:hypothetical protein